jgi:spermidine/putrescine transport system substrate-binding protein
MPQGTTRRAILRGGLIGAAALATSACAFAPQSTAAAKPSAVDTQPPVKPVIDGDLVYFNWADYVDPSIFDAFKKEYGVGVVQSSYDSMESMVDKMNAGNSYDVIFPSAKWTQRLWQAGKLAHIDPNSLVNGEAIYGTYSYFVDPWYDPKSQHSVPFSMYKTGIGWRKDKLGDLTGSWGDMWNAKASGHTYVLDDRDEALGMAALRLGLDVNTAKPDDLAKIVALLKDLRGHLRAFDSDDYDNLLNGNAWMTQAWSGDMTTVLSQAKNPNQYGFEVAREGTPVNTDCYAIPADAQHPGTALLFIDFMLRPENVIKNINYIGYPMPVKGTESAYEALVATLPQCVVTVDDLKNAITFKNVSQADDQARDAAWTDAQAG